MSAMLDRLLDAGRMADIARNESAMECGPLRLFLVTIGARNAPRLEFPVMGRCSADVTARHIDLCEVGERMEVVAA